LSVPIYILKAKKILAKNMISFSIIAFKPFYRFMKIKANRYGFYNLTQFEGIIANKMWKIIITEAVSTVKAR
jgi:hypothetical protein